MVNFEDLNDRQPADAVAPNPLLLQAQDLQRRGMNQKDDEDKDSFDPLAMMKRNALPLTAGLSLGTHAFIGGLRESANLADLARLQNNNMSAWGGVKDLASVRSQLSRAAAVGEESNVLFDIGKRGAIKGALGAGVGLVGCMAVDAQFFPDTPRTYSRLTDLVALPMIGYAPVNPLLKAGGMVGLHTVGRLLDKWDEDPS